MVRHADVKMIVMKEEIYTDRFLETGAFHAVPHRTT